jgi:hypothetical protein
VRAYSLPCAGLVKGEVGFCLMAVVAKFADCGSVCQGKGHSPSVGRGRLPHWAGVASALEGCLAWLPRLTGPKTGRGRGGGGMTRTVLSPAGEDAGAPVDRASARQNWRPGSRRSSSARTRKAAPLHFF